MYHKKIYIYKYENTTAGHGYREKKKNKTKEKTILEERGPCVSNQCYGASLGVLRPASLYKYEEKIKL